MNTDIPSAPILSENDLLARYDTESERKAQTGAYHAPVVGVVAMMAVALPLVFALRSHAAGGIAPVQKGVKSGARPTCILWNTDFERARQIAAASNQTMMIVFHTDWCAACQQMDAEVYGRAPIIAEAQNIVALKIDAEGQPQLALRYHVTQTPTIIWTDAAGNEKHRVTGALNGYELYKSMEQHK